MTFKKNISTLFPRIWGVLLSVVFWCARIIVTMLKIRIQGALVAVWKGEKILLVRKSYRKKWSVPGGQLKKGETWRQAAVRETFEEVGVHLPVEELVFLKEVPGELGPRDRAHLFEVEIDGAIDLKIDRREIIFADFVAPEAALQEDLAEDVKRYLEERRTPLQKR